MRLSFFVCSVVYTFLYEHVFVVCLSCVLSFAGSCMATTKKSNYIYQLDLFVGTKYIRGARDSAPSLMQADLLVSEFRYF